MLLGFAYLLMACSPASAPSGPTKLTVVATTTQIEDIASVIAGEHITVIGLVPRNGDPHEFEPTPDTVKQVAQSAAVFINGVGLEGWLEELVKNAGGERPIFDISKNIPLGKINTAFEEGGDPDPHIWMNPLNMVTAVDNITTGLKQLDPTNGSAFDANATAYKAKLVELDAWAEKALAVIPPERRKLVTMHDAMGYFATRYQFKLVGAVIPSASSEAAETSAKDLSKLVETIKQEQVPAIFTEASINPKLVEQVGAEVNVKVVTDLYIDSLGDKGGEAGTYLDFFRADVNKLVNALK
ncbi:MAG: zinc ABC transporter substrate-binding protein [Chloroflexi bacterium]|nr:zinc ABC transporter substrate-binding protein [Chloroflexota bacterium]